MTVAVQDVKDLSLSGEFNSLTDPQIQARIDLALTFVNAEAWGTKADDGASHLAAHFLASDMRGSTGGATGAVKSEKADGVGRSYGSAAAVATMSDNYLNATTYGQRYLLLRRTLVLTPLTLNTTLAESLVD